MDMNDVTEVKEEVEWAMSPSHDVRSFYPRDHRVVIDNCDERGEAIAEWYLTDVFEATKFIVETLPKGSVLTEELITNLEEVIIDNVSRMMQRVSSVIISSFEEEFGKRSELLTGLKTVLDKTSDYLHPMKQAEDGRDETCEIKKENPQDEASEQACEELKPSVKRKHAKRAGSQAKKKKHHLPLLSCASCSFKTNHKGQLVVHMRKHAISKSLSCPLCKYSGKTPALLKKHSITHKFSKPYTCSFCSFRSASISDLYSHQKTHENDELFKCPHCDLKFERKISLVTHISAGHWKQGRQQRVDTSLKDVYVCIECSYVSASHFKLREHLKSHYCKKEVESTGKQADNSRRPDVNQAKCIKSNNQIVNSQQTVEGDPTKTGAVSLHKTSTITGRASHQLKEVSCNLALLKCDKCDYMTDKASCFDNHKIVHMDEPWLKCSFCEKVYQSRSKFKDHVQFEHIHR